MTETPRTATGDTERIAREFHDCYESLAPYHGWNTQESTRAAWESLPDENRRLMLDVVGQLLQNGVIAVPDSPIAPGNTNTERTVPDEVVKAVREAMRETMDSSIFGNSHDEPAEREYDMAEHVATAAQAALRKEWEEEDYEDGLPCACRYESDGEQVRTCDFHKADKAARARDAEALTTATEALKKIESASPDVTVSIALYAQRVLADIERIADRKES